jgi:hypothetical protein
VQLVLQVLMALLVQLDLQVPLAQSEPLALQEQMVQLVLLDRQGQRALQVPRLRLLTTTLQRLDKQHLAAQMPTL